MVTEEVLVDTSSCISEIIELHSDILVDLLVMLAKVLDAVVPSFPLEGLPIVAMLVGEVAWVVIRSWCG